MAQGNKSRIIIWSIVGVLVVAAVVFLIISRKGSTTGMNYDPERYVKQYETWLAKLEKKAGKLRGDPAWAADLATFDSIFALAKAGETEIRGITDEKAGRAKQKEMTDQWRTMKRLLNQGAGDSDE